MTLRFVIYWHQSHELMARTLSIFQYRPAHTSAAGVTFAFCSALGQTSDLGTFLLPERFCKTRKNCFLEENNSLQSTYQLANHGFPSLSVGESRFPLALSVDESLFPFVLSVGESLFPFASSIGETLFPFGMTGCTSYAQVASLVHRRPVQTDWKLIWQDPKSNIPVTEAVLIYSIRCIQTSKYLGHCNTVFFLDYLDIIGHYGLLWKGEVEIEYLTNQIVHK